MYPKKSAFTAKLEAKDQRRIESVRMPELQASMLAVQREKRSITIHKVNVEASFNPDLFVFGLLPTAMHFKTM